MWRFPQTTPCSPSGCGDSGMMDRRRFLERMAIGAAPAAWPREAAGKGLRATAINHVSYESADYKKTRDFYVDLLGFQVSDEDDRQLYLWAGGALISAKNTPGAKAPRIDHFGFTVEPWDPDAIEAALRERSLPVRLSRNDAHDPANKSAFTRDPNGYMLQLCAADLETKPAPIVSRSRLKAIGIHHISYRCQDYKKTRDFYAGLLGAAVSKDDGQQAYLRFGDAYMIVGNSAGGSPRPVVDVVAWKLSNWNVDRVLSELRSQGLEARSDPDGSILTKDRNGYPLQLCAAETAP